MPSERAGSAPSAAGNNPADSKSREVRLGLVLYGGVSLAIYMNGVAREFFRAVQGQGIYKLIKALTDSDVIVDIISGTSAGGINGIMLAYALCNRRDFSTCAGLWRRDGDIRLLLRAPDRDSGHTTSLLDGEGYYQTRLEAAYREMPDYSNDPNGGDDPSEFNELDLFVTGTDIEGNVFTAFDDAGDPIDVKDHRTVFQLKHRKGRKEPFNPRCVSGDAQATYKALAKLSRITSCFPAAFAPVLVDHAKSGETFEDSSLQQWGRLGEKTYFLDGGILDNKPFTTTLEEIFYRMADHPVERFLLYVEPDPERFERNRPVQEPKFFNVILDSLVSIPGYQSISADLQLLSKHNNAVEQYNRVVTSLRESATEPDIKTKEVYRKSRLVFISDRAVRGVLRHEGRDVLMNRGAQGAAATLFKGFDELVSNQGADLQDQLLRNFDVYYRIRRLFHVVYFLRDLQKPTGSEDRRKLRYMLGRQIELLQILQVAMENLIDKAPIRWSEEVHPNGETQPPDSSSAPSPEWFDEAKRRWRLIEPAAVWSQVQWTFEELLKDHNSVASPFP
jgi:patatin-related protein